MAPRFEEEENKASAHAGHQALVDFEELLGDLSSSFVRVSVEEIDSEVERWLEKIALAMGADRSSVLQMEGGGVCVTHQWSRPGVTTPDIRGLKTNVAKLYPGPLPRCSQANCSHFRVLMKFLRKPTEISPRRVTSL